MSSSIVTRMFFQDMINPFSELCLRYGDIVLQILIPLIILMVFWILLTNKFKENQRHLISLFLIMIGVMLTPLSAFNEQQKTIIIGTLFSPLIVYVYEFLKTNKKASDAKDDLSYNYRWTQIENQSNLIGELLGELTTHASALKSYGLRELETDKWNNSTKMGLISDMHSFWVARYYHLVYLYNRMIQDYEKGKTEYTEDDSKDLLKKYKELKKHLFNIETAVFQCLIFDLGLLQQNYLSRPTVEFPIHMNLLLRKRLENFGILTKGNNIDEIDIFSDDHLEKFNLKMGKHLNGLYAACTLGIKSVDKKMAKK